MNKTYIFKHHSGRRVTKFAKLSTEWLHVLLSKTSKNTQLLRWCWRKSRILLYKIQAWLNIKQTSRKECKMASRETTYFIMYLAFSIISVYARIKRGCDTRLSCFHCPYSRYLYAKITVTIRYLLTSLQSNRQSDLLQCFSRLMQYKQLWPLLQYYKSNTHSAPKNSHFVFWVINSANINRFSKFFHRQIPKKTVWAAMIAISTSS